MAEITWRMTVETFRLLDALAVDLEEAEEGSEDWYRISEDIKALPGCPLNTNENEDIIIPLIVDVPRVGYTGQGSVGDH